MSNQVNIEFLPIDSIGLSDLTYVIIGACEGGKWIFVRNKERQSWELPAGHIEKGESAREAAVRELYEETGVTQASLQALHDYSVSIDGHTRYGRIFFAEVEARGHLPESEIAEIALSQKSPAPATYPYAHWKFIDVLENYISRSK